MPVILNVTFEVGETLKVVNVTIIPDEIVEEDEMFYLQLEGFEDQPNTISLPDGAWATIFDDDSKWCYVFAYICTYLPHYIRNDVISSMSMCKNIFFYLQ